MLTFIYWLLVVEFFFINVSGAVLMWIKGSEIRHDARYYSDDIPRDFARLIGAVAALREAERSRDA